MDLIYKPNHIATAAVETVKLFIKWHFTVELIVHIGVWGSCVLQFDAPFLSFLLTLSFMILISNSSYYTGPKNKGSIAKYFDFENQFTCVISTYTDEMKVSRASRLLTVGQACKFK